MQPRFLRSALIAAVVSGTAAASMAQVVAHSFNVDCGIANLAPAATFSAATAQSGTWNLIDCATFGAAAALVDTHGFTTSATLSIVGSAANYNYPNTTTTGDDELLLDDCQGVTGSTSWFISGLAAGTYDITVYAWDPDSATNTEVTIAGGVNGPMICGGFPFFTGYVLGQTHVQDSVTVWGGADLVITARAAPGDSYGIINGLQIDVGTAAPTTYCTAGSSTNGCNAVISASANPSVSLANACSFTATGVEGAKSGIVFYGVDNTGFVPSPWGAGSSSFLCVKGPTQRMNALSSGGTAGACNGVLLQDWNAYHSAYPGAYGTPFLAGSNAFVQAWYRDPPAIKTTNLSNAVRVTFAP